MSIAKKDYPLPSGCQLHSGDHLSQSEFHQLYSQMPEKFKAELIGGVVYVSQNLGNAHATHHSEVTALLGLYRMRTPGLGLADNGTLILGEEDEVQPDLALYVLPEFGGRTQLTEDDYLQGPPELVVEVAHSSRAIDLFSKKQRYAKAGVQEYLVVSVRPLEIFWFDLPSGKRFVVNDDGSYQSVIFPGLWIHAEALLHQTEKSLDVLDQGLSSPEHAAFVEQLASRRI
jgi:Uma2 family endonuclease